jgi:hypothetical protein
MTRTMKLIRIAVSFAVGTLVGIVAHYTLYRMGLPVEPFIYMAF